MRALGVKFGPQNNKWRQDIVSRSRKEVGGVKRRKVSGYNFYSTQQHLTDRSLNWVYISSLVLQ